MPTTPTYGFRYPASTDPADVPSDLQKLALDVENLIKTINPIRIARIQAGGSFSNASGETQLTSMVEADFSGLGTVVSNTFRIDVAGPYIYIPSLYAFNLGGGSNQKILVRLNPAGANTLLCEVNPDAGVQTAGDDRWLGGHSGYGNFAVNDVIRLNGVNSEAGARDIQGALVLIKLS